MGIIYWFWVLGVGLAAAGEDTFRDNTGQAIFLFVMAIGFWVYGGIFLLHERTTELKNELLRINETLRNRHQ